MSTAFPFTALCSQKGSELMKTVIGLMLALGLILPSTANTRAADGKISVVAAEILGPGTAHVVQFGSV